VLRDYQVQAVDALYKGYTRGLHRLGIQLPTGSGKTVVMADITNKVVRSSGDVNIILHRDTLFDQTVRKLINAGIDATDIGIVKASKNEIHKPCRLVSIHSLRNEARMLQLPKPRLTIIDEAHVSVSPTYKRLYEHLGPNAYLVGLTATWTRSDRLGLGDVWEEIVFKRSISWAVDRGYLVRPVPLQLGGELDLSQVRTTADGEYNDRDLEEVVMIDDLRDTVVRAYHQIVPGKPAVLFAPTQVSARFFGAALRESGVRVAEIFAGTKMKDRKWAFHGFETGAVQVLVTCTALAEGWDCLDEETEVLTEAGWRGIGEIHVGDYVQSLNRKTMRLESVPVTRYVERPTNPGEKMFSAVSQHMNIRTSEGHQFHIRDRRNSYWETVTGTELAQRRDEYALPLAALSAIEFPGIPLTDDEIRFVAWFMTDGGFAGSTQIEIAQAKHYKDDIRALLTRLGLDFTERVRQPGPGCYPNGRPYHVFRVPKGNGTKRRSGWIRLEKYLEKDVSEALYLMTREQFLVFWEEALKGDGDQRWLTCDRQSQVDAYSMMAVTRGLAVSYKTRIAASGVPWFRIAIRDKQWITSDPSDVRSARLSLEDAREGERVWCVTNRNSTLVTRRCGKVVIVGNCPRCAVALFLRPTKHVGLFIQQAGRVLRPWPGKQHALLLDFVGVMDDKDMRAAIDLSTTPDRTPTDPELEICDDCQQWRILRHLGGKNLCTDCAKKIEHEAESRDITAKKINGVYQVDLFAGTSARWLQTDFGMPFIMTSDKSKSRRSRIYFIAPIDGAWNAGVTGSTQSFHGGEWLITGVTAPEAMEVASDTALDDDPTIVHKNSAWRQGKRSPTEGQVTYARKLGIDPEGLSKADLSDAINIKLASRVLGSAYRETYEQRGNNAS
jgi:superfamily II DNA or RNA helicase